MLFLCGRNDFKLCILQFHWLFHIPDEKGVSDKKFKLNHHMLSTNKLLIDVPKH